jgi:hypothetical protein
LTGTVKTAVLKTLRDSRKAIEEVCKNAEKCHTAKEVREVWNTHLNTLSASSFEYGDYYLETVGSSLRMVLYRLIVSSRQDSLAYLEIIQLLDDHFSKLMVLGEVLGLGVMYSRSGYRPDYGLLGPMTIVNGSRGPVAKGRAAQTSVLKTYFNGTSMRSEIKGSELKGLIQDLDARKEMSDVKSVNSVKYASLLIDTFRTLVRVELSEAEKWKDFLQEIKSNRYLSEKDRGYFKSDPDVDKGKFVIPELRFAVVFRNLIGALLATDMRVEKKGREAIDSVAIIFGSEYLETLIMDLVRSVTKPKDEVGKFFSGKVEEFQDHPSIQLFLKQYLKSLNTGQLTQLPTSVDAIKTDKMYVLIQTFENVVKASGSPSVLQAFVNKANK